MKKRKILSTWTPDQFPPVKPISTWTPEQFPPLAPVSTLGYPLKYRLLRKQKPRGGES